MLGRRGERIEEGEASCSHRAAGKEPKRPDLESGRDTPYLWISDLQSVCSKVRFRTAYNRVINCCPSKNQLKTCLSKCFWDTKPAFCS